MKFSNSAIICFLFCSWLVFVGQAAAGILDSNCRQKKGDPPFTCLPNRIPEQEFRQFRYVDYFYENPRHLPLTGIHDDIWIQGEILNEKTKQLLPLAFGESHHIYLPPGTSIRKVNRWVPTLDFSISKTTEVHLASVFLYPVGFQILHRIFWKNNRDSFEFRILRKLKGERWAFGVYEPDQQYPGFMKLRRHSTEGTEREWQRLVEWNGEQLEFKLRMKPLSPTDCRHCHTFHGDKGNNSVFAAKPSSAFFSLPEYESRVGTCEFGPSLPKETLMELSKTFKEKYGYSLFK